MTGLDKITAKIIADAEAKAAEILRAADAECEAIRARYASAAEADRRRIDEQAERECEAIIDRARSSAVSAQKDVLVKAKGDIVEEAYQTAFREIRNLPDAEYLDMLIGMLKGAIKRQLELERQNFEIYGEEPATDTYEVLLNWRDREKHGKALINGLKNSVVGKLKLSDIDRIKLSSDTVDISGGLVLRAGDIETNCSFEMLFSQVRRDTEQKVSQTLFKEKK
jgi:V/A-type H+-transporting ATPase subunit E